MEFLTFISLFWLHPGLFVCVKIYKPTPGPHSTCASSTAQNACIFERAIALGASFNSSWLSSWILAILDSCCTFKYLVPNNIKSGIKMLFHMYNEVVCENDKITVTSTHQLFSMLNSSIVVKLYLLVDDLSIWQEGALWEILFSFLTGECYLIWLTISNWVSDWEYIFSSMSALGPLEVGLLRIEWLFIRVNCLIILLE